MTNVATNNEVVEVEAIEIKEGSIMYVMKETMKNGMQKVEEGRKKVRDVVISETSAACTITKIVVQAEKEECEAAWATGEDKGRERIERWGAWWAAKTSK